jgi:protein O-GlcNAc transferase
MNTSEAQIGRLIAQGITAQNAQRFGEAERAYRAALQIDRGNPRALALMGTLAGIAGRLPMAIDLFLQALQRDGANADLYHNLGETYRLLGDIGKALPALNRAIELRPEHWEAYRSAADAAIEAAEKAGHATARARDLKRIAAKYLLSFGRKRHDQRLGGVEEIFREAAALDPANDAILYAFGTILQDNCRVTEAVEILRRAVALGPRNAQAYNNLGNAYFALQRWGDMEEALRKAVALDPNSASARQNLVSTTLMRWLYDGNATAADIYERHRAWGAEVTAELAPLAASAPPFANTREPDRKLRIAYLSGDFRNHSVGYFFHPLLAHHDPSLVEVYCYAEDKGKPDTVTESLQRLAQGWRETVTLDDAALRAQLRRDKIDIAIDLAGQTAKNRLRALAVRTAPVTATWLGYPATTGLATIDWRITDALVDPPGDERFYTEKLMRLPEGFLCYEALATDIPPVAAAPATAPGQVTFGSFNNPQKLSETTIDAWALVLKALPQSRLLLKAPVFIDPGIRGNFEALFAARGIAAERIDFRAFAQSAAAHLGTYADVDIALDPFPYNGTTTTCEAMWMGVPVIALVGDRHSARVGFDLLTRVGLGELAAADIDRYVAVAVALAQDLPRLQHIRGSLRERMRRSPLCDAKGFAQSFETALRAMWRQWCQSPV